MNGKKLGSLHPLTQIILEATTIFRDFGFTVASGPEIETEFFNFDALNIPANHPARGMQDTFWLKPTGGKDERLLLRTHNTAVDARYLKSHKPPFRIIIPGRVFRNEATDATHEAQFYQLDGLVVDKDVHLGNLKWLLEQFYRRLLGNVQMRWRPSYFSFVEPGVELDIKWGDRWLEVVGAGMLHPNVFQATGYRPEDGWRGLAFGSTVDRLAMIKYGIPDIRLFYSGDKRFLEQFS